MTEGQIEEFSISSTSPLTPKINVLGDSPSFIEKVDLVLQMAVD